MVTSTDLTDQRLSQHSIAEVSNYKHSDGDEGSCKEPNKPQQYEGKHGDEEMDMDSEASSSCSTPVTRVRNVRNTGRLGNANACLDMYSSSHHAAATMAMTRAETRVLKRWKFLLFFILGVSMIGVGLATYFFTAKSETVDFQLQFAQDAHKVLEALGGSLDLTLMAVDALAVTMVSFAHYAGQEWPFVTIPDFEVRASKIRSLSKAVFLNIYPVVSEENREAWENYTSNNNGWVDESMRIQEKDYQTYHGPRPLPQKGEYEVYDVIHDSEEYYKEEPGKEGTNRTGMHMPIWQSSPVTPTAFPPYNWDLLASLGTTSIYTVLETKRALISEAYMIPDYGNEELMAETLEFADWFRDFLDPGKDPMEPVSDIYYPILASMRDGVSVGMNDETDAPPSATLANDTNNNVLAFLSLSIYWRDTLEKILPPGSGGIVVVFENPCNPSFTYQIDGPNATYLGKGDLHDVRYDSLVQSSKLTKSLHGGDDDQPEHVYTGINVHDGYCPFTIHVYPSADMESDYRSSQPIVFSVAAILIFAVTCTVFIMYDRWVERRQVKVLGSALEATFNVGLLEEKVRERTQKLESSNRRLEQANAQLEQANAQVLLASAAQLRTFASMSHEIRTPLNCIVGLSSVLAEDVDLNAKQRESINMINHSSDLLRNVVNDVLDYAKLESGNFAIDEQQISLQETLNTVVHSIGSNESILASKPTLRLVTHYDSHVPEYIVSDGRRLQQILYNLLGNALKFSEDGGIVEFGVRIIAIDDDTASPDAWGRSASEDDDSFCMDETISSERHVHVKRQTVKASSQQFQSSNTPQRIRFIVKDYGKGIAAKDFETIFQPFSQASQETSNTYGGTGLGLSITARLVEALGGSISIDSKLGEWSQFTVELPLRQEMNDCIESDGPTAIRRNSTGADIGYLSSRLENATVCLVGPAQNLEQTTNMFRACKVSFALFDRVDALEAYISTNDKRLGSGAEQVPELSHREHQARTFICLVQEDLVGQDMRSLLARHPSKTVLLTFGPKYRLAGVDGHYPSLKQMLPSVLMKDLGDYCRSMASSKELTERFVEGETRNSWLSSSHNDDTTNSSATPSLSASHRKAIQGSVLIQNDHGAKGGTERSAPAVRTPSAENVSSVAPATIHPSSPFGHLRVLIAEDNLVNQKVLGGILDRLGVKNVEIVDNGQKAVDREASNPFDIILMDVQMPVMDGVEACKLIRSRHRRETDSEQHALASVVFVTAQVSLAFQAEYFEAGAYDFLSKPCSMNGVRDCLKKYVETQRSTRSLSSKPDDGNADDHASCDLVHC